MVAAVFSFYPMAPAVAGLPAPVHDRDVVIAGDVYAGDPGHGMKALQPLRELGEPLAEIADVMPYRHLQMAFDSFYPNTGELISHWKSLYLGELGDDAVESMVERSEHRSSRATMVWVQHLGGALHRMPTTATAFPGMSRAPSCGRPARRGAPWR
jgi:hypothetical protein